MTIHKEGFPLTTLAEWRRDAPPKHPERQWKPYASAKEAARAWLDALPSLPDEIGKVLVDHDAFGLVNSWCAEPEVKLAFDKMGEARNTDLLVGARDRHGKYLIAVEAKAAEAFGTSIESTMRAARVRLSAANAKRPSRGVKRLNALCAAYLGATLDEEPALATLQYQLLTATAGAIHVAVKRRVDRTVFLVQEFVSERTTSRTRERNTDALNAFVQRFTNEAVREVPSGRIIEVPLPTGVIRDGRPQFFIGKVERHLPPGLE